MSLKEKLKFMSTIEIYELVLNREISRFPEFFWEGQEGKLKGLECLDYLLFTKLKWKKEDVPKKFSKQILLENKLGGMLAQCFHNSPLECILTLMGDNYKPWEYNVAPTNYWNRETALFAIEYMMNELQWTDEEIKTKLCLQTFKDFKLASMMMKVYDSSPYKAINDLFPGKFKEWELNNVPLNFWTEENCKKAIYWIIENKLDENYKEMSCEELRIVFHENGLGYMLQHKFSNSIKKVFNFVNIDFKNKQKICA